MFISLSENRNTGRDVFAIQPTGTNRGRDAFRLHPECERAIDFAAQHLVEEQFRKSELSELGLSAFHYKD